MHGLHKERWQDKGPLRAQGAEQGMSSGEFGHGLLCQPQETDGAVLPQAGRPKYTVEDVVLLLLYADPHPIEGRVRQTEQVFLAATEVLGAPGVEPPIYHGRRFGPHSDHVEGAIEQLILSNSVRATGDRRRSDYRLEITPLGRARIKVKYASLPPRTREMLAQKRLEWDTFTPAGIVDYACIHSRERLENSVFRDRFGAWWGNADQKEEHHGP